MRLKKNVNPIGIQAELLLALIIAERVYDEHGTELVITSLNDSYHSWTSLHYNGCAADLRVRDFPPSVKHADVAEQIKSRLTKDYDVIAEANHIHIEWQPRRR